MRAHQEDAHRQPGARTHMWEASSPASAGGRSAVTAPFHRMLDGGPARVDTAWLEEGEGGRAADRAVWLQSHAVKQAACGHLNRGRRARGCPASSTLRKRRTASAIVVRAGMMTFQKHRVK